MGRVYLWSMTKQQNSIRGQMTLNGIPTDRRHMYFYILLFLGTTLLHGAWKNSLPEVAISAIEAGERVAEVQHELILAESRFAP